jgi:hypothetical protein
MQARHLQQLQQPQQLQQLQQPQLFQATSHRRLAARAVLVQPIPRVWF